MNLGALNLWPIFLAALASFAFGGLYYNALGKQWMAARNVSLADMQRARAEMGITPYIVSIIALLVMAVMLSGVLVHLARSGMPINLRTGAISALLIWIGFVITTLAVNYSFQGSKRALTLIDGAHWLGVLLIQGAILGWWSLG